MNRDLLQKVGLAALAVISIGLAGCLQSTHNGFDPSKPNNGANANGGCPEGFVLNGAQCTLTGVVGDLAQTLQGTPLSGLVSCLNPTANDVLDGADPLVTNLLNALANQAVDPAAVQSSATDLASGLASLGKNVPTVISALAGDQTAIAQCESDPGSPSLTP